jgi:hypothetical protein
MNGNKGLGLRARRIDALRYVDYAHVDEPESLEDTEGIC